jgi:glucose/arabinose dehydrogenase
MTRVAQCLLDTKRGDSGLGCTDSLDISGILVVYEQHSPHETESVKTIAITVVALLVSTACTSDDSATSAPVATTADTALSTTTGGISTGDNTSTTAASLAQNNDAAFEDVALSTLTVALAEQPMVMRPNRDGSTWIAQRAGTIVGLDLTTGELSDPVLDLSDDISTDGERGLLGMAFDPSGERVYVHFSGLDGETNLASFAFDPNGIDPNTRAQHLTLEQPASNHNGGDLHFGTDGLLYLALGDGGSQGDPSGNGQNPETLLGSILRLEVDGTDGYQIPDDNPFADGGGRGEVYLYGVRNPWRFDIDEPTGDIWVADVGQGDVEEITLLGSDTGFGHGANLGWALREGSASFEGGDEPEGHIGPVFDYTHERGCSVTGGYVYRGDAIAGLDGAFVYADWCEGSVHAVTPSGVDRALGPEFGPNEIVSFGISSDGELFVLQASGPIVALLAAE